MADMPRFCINWLYAFIWVAECQCNEFGTIKTKLGDRDPDLTCNDSGVCSCNSAFEGDKCNTCKNSTYTGSKCDDCVANYYGFPNCQGKSFHFPFSHNEPTVDYFG